MIPINDYRQFIAELTAKASDLSGVPVASMRLAVTESQLVTLLKDLKGIIVCGNIPGEKITTVDYWRTEHECLLMVLEKMPADWQGTELENAELERMQRLMQQLARLIAGDDFQQFCDRADLDHSAPMNVEWEYNQYGGLHGLSVTFKLLSS